MKKLNRAFLSAAVALIAASGLFANPKAAGAKAERPKIELPDEAVLKAYHESESKALELLLDAQVKAGIISREWADARLAILRAVQADCKGFCIVEHRTDIPFGTPGFRRGPHNGKHECRPDLKKGKHGAGKNGFKKHGAPGRGDFRPDESDESEE